MIYDYKKLKRFLIYILAYTHLPEFSFDETKNDRSNRKESLRPAQNFFFSPPKKTAQASKNFKHCSSEKKHSPTVYCVSSFLSLGEKAFISNTLTTIRVKIKI